MHLATGIPRGVEWHKKSKLSVFDPDAVEETNFSAGRHKAEPSGRVRYPERDELLNLHFKWLGCEYVQSRSDLLRKGLGSLDHEQKWGHQYELSTAENRKRLEEMLAASVDVLDPGLDHHSSHTGKRCGDAKSRTGSPDISRNLARRSSGLLPTLSGERRPSWSLSGAAVQLSFSPIGRLRTRLPVAAKMAFASAGVNGGNPGSPTPPACVPGGASTMCTVTAFG